MAYSTTLYAVDIDLLKAALGSDDTSLAKRIRDHNAATPVETFERKQIWVAVLEDGSITLDREPATLEAVLERYAQLERHDVVHFLGKDAEMQKRLLEGFSEAAVSMAERGGRAAKISGHPSVKDLEEFYAYDDQVAQPDETAAQIDRAVGDLIAGHVSDDLPTACYGYAFQQLCATLGRRLDDGDAIGEIRPLDLETPLEDFREFPQVPADGDFPIVSYLTSKELQKELKRLSRRKRSPAEDADIEAARQALLRCLNEAADEGLGVVTFYY